jgi:uncharacterized RDD family membrane protein YckC
MEKANFFGRFLAWFLDGIFMGFIGLFGGLIIFGLISLMGGTESDFAVILIIMLTCVLVLILLLLQFVYFGYFWSTSGQSLGMKLVNIKVVRQDGEQLTFLRAGLRGSVGYWISSLVFNLGFLWAAFDTEKETWHDKIFETWVVNS